MNKGPSITIDLLLIIGVLWLVVRGQGRSWIDTLFHYQPVSLDLNPLDAIGGAISRANPLGGIGEAIGNIGSMIRNPTTSNEPQPQNAQNPAEGGVQLTVDGVTDFLTGNILNPNRPIKRIGRQQ